MTTPHATDSPPLVTEEDVLARVTALIGPTITDGQLWLLFVDGDDRQAPVVVPISRTPHHPEQRWLTALATVLGGVTPELATARGPGAVIFVRERAGEEGELPLDRTWAAALEDVGRAAELLVRGVCLSTPGGVSRLG